MSKDKNPPMRLRQRFPGKQSDKKQNAAPDKNSQNEYEVGYGKPPKATQFKKGQSGNPKGRPKGARNTRKLALEKLDETMLVKQDGVTKNLPRREIMILALSRKAMQGDIRAIDKIISLVTPLEEARDQAENRKLSEADEEILELMKAEILSEKEESEDA